jgi:Co/Zn/Cd efflux system component
MTAVTMVVEVAAGIAFGSMALLDRQAPEAVVEHLRRSVESGTARVVDLHIWEIGPGYRAAIVSLEAEDAPSPAEVEASIPPDLGIAHLTVEVRGKDGRSGSARDGGSGP